MTDKKLLAKLLRIKGYHVKWYDIYAKKGEIHIGVKPHKTGSRCPECDRREKIVATLPEHRKWLDVMICGMRVFFFISQEKLNVRRMAGSRKKYPGQIPLQESPTGSSI